MTKFRKAGITAALFLILITAGCSKAGRTESAENSVTSDITAAETADVDLEQDPEIGESQAEEVRASTDLFFEDGAVCTQYLRLAPPQGWEGHVTYHYFQEPDTGRYALDVIENESMTATEGVGGALLSIAVYETYPEERGMENASYLGMLSSDDGRYFYVFMEHFPGAEYTEGTEETYVNAMAAADSIAGNIEGRNGFSFEAGKEPAQTQEQEEQEE